MARHGWFLALVCGGLVVWANTSVSAPTAQPDLAAMARAAAKQFRPLTEADIAGAKTELVAALGRLEQRLVQDGENGKAWRAYLGLDALQKQLKVAKPDLAVLDKTYQKFNSDYSALGLVWFSEVRTAIYHFLGVSRGVGNPKLQAAYEKVVIGLATRLESFAKSPSAADAQTINETLSWLNNANQAPELVKAVASRYGQPNLLLDLSPVTVNGLFGMELDEDTSVNDVIAGARVTGTGRTVGRVKAQLVPDANQAVIDAVFTGQANTETVGRKGPAAVYTVGTTKLDGLKRIWIATDGIHSYPAVSSAETSTTITGISVRCNCGLVQSIANNQAHKQLPRAERQASQIARFRLNERMDQQAAEMIARNNDEFDTRMRIPLSERSVYPLLTFASTLAGAEIRGLSSSGLQVATAILPPPPVAGLDMNLRLHESAVNNMAATALAGMTVHDEEFQAFAKNMFGELPEGFQGNPDEEPWAITFADKRPIFLTVGDGELRVTVRGAAFHRGGSSQPGADVSALYKLVSANGEVKAVRQGGIEVTSPDGAETGGRAAGVRGDLRKRFEKIFRPEMKGDALTFTGSMARLGTFKPVHLTSKDGWIAVGMKKTADKPAAKPGAKAAEQPAKKTAAKPK